MILSCSLVNVQLRELLIGLGCRGIGICGWYVNITVGQTGQHFHNQKLSSCPKFQYSPLTLIKKKKISVSLFLTAQVAFHSVSVQNSLAFTRLSSITDTPISEDSISRTPFLPKYFSVVCV
jgi:hypothetical protein